MKQRSLPSVISLVQAAHTNSLRRNTEAALSHPLLLPPDVIQLCHAPPQLYKFFPLQVALRILTPVTTLWPHTHVPILLQRPSPPQTLVFQPGWANTRLRPGQAVFLHTTEPIVQLDGASTKLQAHRQDQMVLHYGTIITALNLEHRHFLLQQKTPGQSFLLSRDGYAQRDMAPAGLQVELCKEETF